MVNVRYAVLGEDGSTVVGLVVIDSVSATEYMGRSVVRIDGKKSVGIGSSYDGKDFSSLPVKQDPRGQREAERRAAAADIKTGQLTLAKITAYLEALNPEDFA